MKKAAVIILSLIFIISAIALKSEASRSDFIIEDGVLIGYVGADADVIVPPDIGMIAFGVFSSGSVSSVTVLNDSCRLDNGAVSPDIPIRASAGSVAEKYAEESGNPFEALSDYPTVNVYIVYRFDDGTDAAEPHSSRVPVYSPFSYNSPEIEGATANFNVVSGDTEDKDLSFLVVYTRFSPDQKDGWVIDGKNVIKYYDSAKKNYVRSETRVIDGVERTFNELGELVLSGETITVDGETYYLLNNRICVGAVRIGNGIYYFNESGQMVKDSTVGGNTYDKEGRMTASGSFVGLSGVYYYLDGNELTAGFALINGNLYYFGDDYAMVSKGEYAGYSFDESGHLIGLTVNDLDIRYEETKTYNKKELKPDVDVYFKEIELVEGEQYSIEYSDNISPGTGKITVKGKGIISGEKELSFEIVGKETFTLTIKYQNSRGYEMSAPHIEELTPGSSYKVESPSINGYKPDKAFVEGVMGDSDFGTVVTYISERETETEKQTEPVTETETEIGTEPVSETEKENVPTEPEEQKTKTVYTYDYSLFFKVAGIATLLVAVAVFLILRFGRKSDGKPSKKVKNQPGLFDANGNLFEFESKKSSDTLTPLPLDNNDSLQNEKTKTMKFDLHEIEVVDFDEKSESSDFVDPSEVSDVQPAPVSVPKRYKYRKK